MKPNNIKCIWLACIAAVAMCMTLNTAYADNLGNGYISNVTGAGECAVITQTGNSHKWDIQAGGTYTVTLTIPVADCDPLSQIGVIVHNSVGGNIYVLADQTIGRTINGVPYNDYEFTVTLGGQCETMPIEYCTHNAAGQPANLPGTGLFAQGPNSYDVYDGGDGFIGHLRIATFNDSCAVTGNPNCQEQPTPTPTPTPCTASIQACKYYDFNANATRDAGELLLAWPFCLTSLTDPNFSPVRQTSSDGSCTTFSNLGPGTYVVTEGTAPGFFGTTNSSTITIDHCDQTVTVNFGNYCTVPSGGLTLGFWSNKNGNKLLTGNPSGTGTTLLPAVVTLLNAGTPTCPGGVLRNANGSVHVFTNSYSAFRTWLLGANATNMAYMLSAQLVALKLDVNFGFVNGGAFDLCSSMTVNSLISTAADQLCMDGYTIAGNPTRVAQEMLKNCIDAINNNGPVVPVTPCDHSGASVSCP
jgi:hypothetical protein